MYYLFKKNVLYILNTILYCFYSILPMIIIPNNVVTELLCVSEQQTVVF